jgi:hypothetical protein
MNQQKAQSSGLLLVVQALVAVAFVAVVLISAVVLVVLLGKGIPVSTTAFEEAIPTAPVASPTSKAPAEPIPPPARLRFDGLYRSTVGNSKGGSSNGYLRFYEDGVVLSVSSNGQAEQVAKWLGKSYLGAGKGVISLSGASVKFTTETDDGSVDYEGTIQGDTLRLKMHSNINGHNADKTFDFVPVTFDEQSSDKR